jgi:hypothetical protein
MQNVSFDIKKTVDNVTNMYHRVDVRGELVDSIWLGADRTDKIIKNVCHNVEKNKRVCH